VIKAIGGYYLGLKLYRRGGQRHVSPEDLKVKADDLLLYMVERGMIEMGGDKMIRIQAGHKSAVAATN
jgi:hypothetical protein